MSAKKLGRFTAGLFVALGLAFGGSLFASAGGSGAVPVAADTATIGAAAAQMDFEWG
ncbi:hypothetical protein ACQP2Y_04395 [Actinoplanes sp. CA-051413]|uniref:hypothetical protein n=1 Tax=Actinoplanes sp. CA-051413 TaxID=3239899 RepID=UPI003D979183